MQYKYLNFAKVRANPYEFPEHIEYINTYDLLTNRKSFIISNYPIYSPYFNEYSKLWSFNYMRKNKQKEYPLEEYVVISISEFDKEYNSHDDKKLVGEDGVHTFFSTVSHDLKRHVKLFVDYQLKDQVPLRIRGNAEYIITIKKREKKYPFLLYVYYLPFKLTNKIVRYYIKKYELKRTKINRKTQRKPISRYKRNDMTLPYAILRSMATSLKRVCDWFDTFYYFRLKALISQEDDIKGRKINLNINLCDINYNNHSVYDSTFLSFAYEVKCSHEFRNLDTFTGLRPTVEELRKVDSKLYNTLIDLIEEENLND